MWHNREEDEVGQLFSCRDEQIHMVLAERLAEGPVGIIVQHNADRLLAGICDKFK